MKLGEVSSNALKSWEDVHGQGKGNQLAPLANAAELLVIECDYTTVTPLNIFRAFNWSCRTFVSSTTKDSKRAKSSYATMSGQAGQDAKFFTRGKIEVRTRIYSLFYHANDNGPYRSFERSFMPLRQRTRSFRSERLSWRKLLLILLWATIVGINTTFIRPCTYATVSHTVSPLFTDVVQCLGTPLLEIKKSERSCDAQVDVHLWPSTQWSISSSLVMGVRSLIKYTLLFPVFFRWGPNFQLVNQISNVCRTAMTEIP